MNWPVVTVEDIAAPTSSSIAIGPFGSRLTADMYSTSGVPLVRGQDISDGRSVQLKDPVFVPQDVADAIPGCLVRDGDIVFPHRGAIGRVGLVEDGEYLLSSSMMKLTCDPLKAVPEYVLYYFRGPGQAELLSRASTVGTPGIAQPLRSLRGIPVPLPSLVTQRGIADLLGALDDKIDSNDRLISLHRAHLVTEFESTLRSPDVQKVMLTDILFLNPHYSKPADGVVTYLEMQKLPVSDWVIREWADRENASGTRFQNGDTLFARITPCLENGKLGYVDFLDEDEVGFGSTEFVVMRPKDGVPRALPYLIAASDSFRDYAIRHMYGTSGRQRVVAKDLEGYELSLPAIEDMADFGRRAEAMFEHAGALRDESRTLAQLRDTLLPSLMSGRLSVRDAEDLVSEVV